MLIDEYSPDGLTFPTSEDIMDYMESTGLAEYFRGINATDGQELDGIIEIFNNSDLSEVMNWSLPFKPLPKERTTFEFITVGLLLTVISIFGLVGNIVAIIVLSRPAMKGSFSSLLIGLSSFDLLYLAIGIAIFGLPALSKDYHDLFLPFIMPIGFGVGHVGRVGSVFVTMSVTIERYFAIVHPLKHFSGKRYLLVTPIVTTILYNIPKFFEFQRSEENVVEETQLRANKAYAVWYIFWSKFILIEVIPYFTIVVLNSAIVRKIWKSNKFRRRFVTNGSQSALNNVALATSVSAAASAATGGQAVPEPNFNTSGRQHKRGCRQFSRQSMSRIDVIESVPTPPPISVASTRSTARNSDDSEASTTAAAAAAAIAANAALGVPVNGSSSSANNNQVEMTARQRREANLGIVLVSISVLFILCQSVKIVPDLYEVIYCRIGTSGLNGQGLCVNNFTIDSIIDISHLFLAINSSVNVIIYTLRGEKFREVLTTTFGLENWLLCRQRRALTRMPRGFAGMGENGAANLGAAVNGESIALVPLNRCNSEYHTQVISTGASLVVEPINKLVNGTALSKFSSPTGSLSRIRNGTVQIV